MVDANKRKASQARHRKKAYTRQQYYNLPSHRGNHGTTGDSYALYESDSTFRVQELQPQGNLRRVEASFILRQVSLDVIPAAPKQTVCTPREKKTQNKTTAALLSVVAWPDTLEDGESGMPRFCIPAVGRFHLLYQYTSTTTP